MLSHKELTFNSLQYVKSVTLTPLARTKHLQPSQYQTSEGLIHCQRGTHHLSLEINTADKNKTKKTLKHLNTNLAHVPHLISNKDDIGIISCLEGVEAVSVIPEKIPPRLAAS